MTNSKDIAGLIGPMHTSLVLSENEFVQPHLYDGLIPPVVYLSGSLFFLAGLSMVRAYNRWVAGWPVLVTHTGCFGCSPRSNTSRSSRNPAPCWCWKWLALQLEFF